MILNPNKYFAFFHSLIFFLPGQSKQSRGQVMLLPWRNKKTAYNKNNSLLTEMTKKMMGRGKTLIFWYKYESYRTNRDYLLVHGKLVPDRLRKAQMVLGKIDVPQELSFPVHLQNMQTKYLHIPSYSKLYTPHQASHYTGETLPLSDTPFPATLL